MIDYEELKKDLIAHKYTLLQEYQIDSLWDILNRVKKENTEGILVETGIYRGGSSVIMQYANKILDLNKKLYLFDSFAGLPNIKETKIKNPKFEGHGAGLYKASLKEVIDNFKRYELYDEENIIITSGWFEDTLPSFDYGNIALLRFDADIYSSTLDVMNNLYNKVSDKGYIIIDDYCLLGCRKAIEEFREKNNIQDQMYTPYNNPVKEDEYICASWWQKGFKNE